MQSISEQISTNNHFDVVHLLSIDHGQLKQSLKIILDGHINSKEKIYWSKKFVSALKKHYLAKEKTVYDSIADMDNLHLLILEAEIEHDIIRKKIESLTEKLVTIKHLDVYTEAELKVLAKFVGQYLAREEHDLFPILRRELDQSILNEIGFQFAIMRKFTPIELQDYPTVQDEIYQKYPDHLKNVYKVSKDFVKKVNLYINGLITESRYI
jgi:Hemerythrin HHE cation binding domain